jgi:hypothetical protein
MLRVLLALLALLAIVRDDEWKVIEGCRLMAYSPTWIASGCFAAIRDHLVLVDPLAAGAFFAI